MKKFIFFLFSAIFSLSIGFFTYKYYEQLSLDRLEEKYIEKFSDVQSYVKNSIINQFNSNSTVNFYQIIDPLLKKDVDLAMFYKDDQISQIFSQQKFSQENLKLFNQVYFESKGILKDFIFSDSKKIIASRIEVSHQGNQFVYFLIFNNQSYFEEKADLENEIRKNAFFLGVFYLILLFFLIKIVNKKFKQTKQDDIEKPVFQETTEFTELEEETPSHKSPIPQLEEQKSKPDLKIDEEPALPNNQKIEEQSKETVEKEEKIQKEEDKEDKKEEIPIELKNLKEMLKILFSSHENVTYQRFFQNEQVRNFKAIMEYQENLELIYLSDQRIKEILLAWLFADSIESFIKKSIAEIHRISKQKITLYFEEKNVKLVLKQLSQISNLKTSSESYLPFGKDMHEFFVAPWLGEEKKFFNEALPYLEMKKDLTVINFQWMSEKNFLIKTIYLNEDFQSVFDEEKLVLYYAIRLFFSQLQTYSKLHKDLQAPKKLDEKIKFLFETLYQQDPLIQRILIPNLALNRNNASPKESLIFYKWTLIKKKGDQSNWEKILKLLKEKLKEENILIIDDRYDFISLSYSDQKDFIKEVLEKIIIDEAGMEGLNLHWKESLIPIPSKDELDKKEIPLIDQVNQIDQVDEVNQVDQDNQPNQTTEVNEQ